MIHLTPAQIKQLIEDMPEVLIWQEEPGARNGDRFVFSWSKVHTMNGEPYGSVVEDVAVRLTANPRRHKKGYWFAPYVWVGIERVIYMKSGGGVTGNRRASIDPDAPLEIVEDKGPEQTEIEEGVRSAKRNEIKATSENRRARHPWKRAA